MTRAATKGDLAAVYGLMRQLSNHEFTQEQFEDCYLYNLERGRVLVYEKDGIVCGCIVFTVHYHMHFSRKSAEIVNLIVEDRCRNRGIGQKLLAAVEQIAADNGCVCIEVDSGRQREGAHRFYQRKGFTCNHYKFTKGLSQ